MSMFSNMTDGANAIAPQYPQPGQMIQQGYPQGQNFPQGQMVQQGQMTQQMPMPNVTPMPTNPLQSQAVFNLSTMDSLWNQTKAEKFEDFEGKFPVVIESVELTTRKKDGCPQLAWKVKITEGQYMNRKKVKFASINEQGMKYLKADLETCGWHKKHQKLSDLQTPQGIADLVGLHLDATFAIKNGYQQIYFNNQRTAPQGVNVPMMMAQPMTQTQQQPMVTQQPSAQAMTQPITAQPPINTTPAMTAFANADEADAADLGNSEFAPEDLPF